MVGPDQPGAEPVPPAGTGPLASTGSWAGAGQALDVLDAVLGYLAGLDVAALTAVEQAECLLRLQRAASVQVAVRSRVLTAFGAGRGHAADGHGTVRSWLRWQARITGQAAGAEVAWSRRLAAHPAVRDALAAGVVSESWARELCDWSDLLPEPGRAGADEILLAAAGAGAGLADLAGLAEEIRNRTATPDEDGDDDGPDGRSIQLDLHYRGAGQLRGDLTPRCAAAVQAVLDALGKKQGPEDTRTRAQRDHDALEDACNRLIASNCLPDRAGQSTQLQLIMTPDQALGLPGAGDASGYAGPGPLATPGDACDAQIVPIVVGHVDHDLLGRLAATLAQASGTGPAGHDLLAGLAASHSDSGDNPITPAHDLPGQTGIGQAGTGQARTSQAGTRPGDRLAAAYAGELVLRTAIALLSGPAGLASRLRTTTLTGPAASISLPLDVGTATDTIPPHLRRAVIIRDQHCSFPGCEQPPAASQVHHIIPVSEGGPTRLDNLLLACRFHHLIAIHEWGWRLILNADGTKTAISPDRRRVLRTHSPPAAA